VSLIVRLMRRGGYVAALSSGLDRRRFLQAAGALLAGAGVWAARPGGPIGETIFGKWSTLQADEVTQDLLAPLAGDRLTVTGPGIDEALDITEVTATVTNRNSGAVTDVFTVTLEGPATGSLEQGTYDVRHGDTGWFPLFIVPVGLPGGATQLYEAVFNRLR
jgi:hypothetical protein